MLMRCIHYGGIEAIYDKPLDAIYTKNSATEGYDPNPNGYFEVRNPQDYLSSGAVKGKCMKLFLSSIAWKFPLAYRVVFVTRNPKDRFRSSCKMFGIDKVRKSISAFSPSNYKAEVESNVDSFRMCNNLISLTILDFNKIVEDPVNEFKKLSDWGIDPFEMAQYVDPKLANRL
jgi:hypothetical protein